MTPAASVAVAVAVVSIGIAARVPTLSPVLLKSTAPLVYREAPVTPAASVAVAVVVVSIGIAARVPTLFSFSRLATVMRSPTTR